MMMSVNEAGTDDFVGTINDLGVFRRLDVVPYFRYFAILNEEAGSGWYHVVVVIMNEEGAIFENDAGGNHFTCAMMEGSIRSRASPIYMNSAAANKACNSGSSRSETPNPLKLRKSYVGTNQTLAVPPYHQRVNKD
jgi:hypothetical protein